MTTTNDALRQALERIERAANVAWRSEKTRAEVLDALIKDIGAALETAGMVEEEGRYSFVDDAEPAVNDMLGRCDWPKDQLFRFYDEPGEHDPCYVVMPDGSSLPLNHHAGLGVDIARAQFIIAACNAALSPSPMGKADAAIDRVKDRAPDDVTEDAIRGRARALVIKNGWRPGDKVHLHGALELLTAFGMDLTAHPALERCAHPECGCEYDAVCGGTLSPPAQSVGTEEEAAEYNARFDPANEAGQEVFDAGWKCGWMFARFDGCWDDEAEEAFKRDYDSVAAGEAWDAHRDDFFKRLPLAALSPQPPLPEAGERGDDGSNGAFWAIERSDIPWGSRAAGVTLYRSTRVVESWTDNIYHAMQFATRQGAEVWHKSREASDPALRVVEHAWIATKDGWRPAHPPGSNEWWTVRRVANGDAQRPWYELTDADRAALSPPDRGEAQEEGGDHDL